MANSPNSAGELGQGDALESTPRVPASPQGVTASAPGRVREALVPPECVEKGCPLVARYQVGAQQYQALKTRYEEATQPGFVGRMWGKLPGWVSAPLPWVLVSVLSLSGGWIAHPDTTNVLPPPIVKIEPAGALEGEAFAQRVDASDDLLPGLMEPGTRDLWEQWQDAREEGD